MVRESRRQGTELPSLQALADDAVLEMGHAVGLAEPGLFKLDSVRELGAAKRDSQAAVSPAVLPNAVDQTHNTDDIPARHPQLTEQGASIGSMKGVLLASQVRVPARSTPMAAPVLAHVLPTPSPGSRVASRIITWRRNGTTTRFTPSGSSMKGQWPLPFRITTSAPGKTSRCRSASATGR